MKKRVSSWCVKIISAVLSFAILFECNTAAFAGVDFSQWDESLPYVGFDAAALSDFDAKLEDLFLKGEEGNIYEASLNRETNLILKSLASNKSRAKLAALIKTGKTKYGSMSPMYVKRVGAKDIKNLENDLMAYLAAYFITPRVMPLKEYEKFYNTIIDEAAREYLQNNPSLSAIPYKSPLDAASAKLKEGYPLKDYYAQYQKEAKEEIAWRKANKTKVDASAYKVLRKYIEAVGAENLSSNVLRYLIHLKIGGKAVMTAAEKENIYNYAVSRLEKQNLNSLKLGITSGKKEKKIAAVLLGDIIDTIIIGSYVSAKDGGRYAKAVKRVIYASENGAGFGQILSNGFSALLAAEEYSSLREMLSRYTLKEKEGASFGEYLNLTLYSSKARTAGGQFLGKASYQTQYSGDYLYGNSFTDIALLLAEDGGKEALAILKEYGADKGLEGGIKPFLAGALISGKSGLSAEAAGNMAAAFANLTLGDITALQEYDIDRDLLSRYPAIKGKLNSGAVITPNQLAARKARNKRFDYLDNAAFAGDILLLIWGTVALAKLGGKAFALSKSTYTAVKAGRIADSAKRISYIRANYAKMGKYISARNNMLRLSGRIKGSSLQVKGAAAAAGVGTNESRQAIKLENYFNNKQLASLYDSRKKAVMAVRNSANPTQRQVTKAKLATAEYKAKQAQINLVKKARAYGSSVESKNAAYLQKVKDYNSNVNIYNSKLSKLASLKAEGGAASEIEVLGKEIKSLASDLKTVPSAPLYTAGELGYLKAGEMFSSALKSLNSARADYKAAGWWNKNILKPWQNFWAPSGDGTLGIAALETERGITIAEALGINRPYNPNYTKGFKLFGGASDKTPVNKFYNFLSAHKMKPAADFLKFINNRATVLGTALIFNYNVATTVPEVGAFGRNLTAGTEWVLNTEKGLNLGKTLSFGTARASAPLMPVMPKVQPVSVIDPKIFEFFRGVPLPGGNLINDFSIKGLLGNVSKAGYSLAGAAGMGLMFAKDLYGYFDRRLLNINISPAKSFGVKLFDSPASSEFKVYGDNNFSWELSRKAAALGGWDFVWPGGYDDVSRVFGTDKYVYEIPAIPHLTSSTSSYRTRPYYADERARRAASQQKIGEEKALSAAWDEVKANPKGKASKLMAEIKVDNFTFKILHGHAATNRKGDLVVQGPELKRLRGTFSNFGLTKIIFKHSDDRLKDGRKYNGEKYISKGDLLKLPSILREYAPVSQEAGFPEKLTYRIKGDDGEELVIVFSALRKAGEYSLVSMFYRKIDGKGGNFSEKLTSDLNDYMSFNKGLNFLEADNIAFSSEAQAAAGRRNFDVSLEGKSYTVSVINGAGRDMVLPVSLSFHEDFDTNGYTNIVFNNNTAELREFGKKPRTMSNFYLRLKTENKSLIKFAQALKDAKENITIKLWQYGIEPSKTVTVPLYNADGKEELPIKVITDANFLKQGDKLVLMPSGNVGVMSNKSAMPSSLGSTVVVRIPKNQRGTLLKVLEQSKNVLPIEVMQNHNKADVITKEGFYINPSLGKTLGPVLPESLGVSEAFATNLMYVVNYLPGLLSPMLNPLVKKFGEVAMFKVSIVISMLAAVIPAIFGFYGYSYAMEPTLLRNISLGLALFALGFSINIRNVLGNSLINMNRGAMPIAKDKKKEEQNFSEALKVTTDILIEKFKKLFSGGSDFSMEDILFYNRSFINKNIGTMAFLVAPSALNYAGRAFGMDFNFGWDVSLPLYAAYSAYAGYRVHRTNLRDNIIIDHIKNDVYQMASAGDETEAAAIAAESAKQENKKSYWQDIKEVFDIMLHKEGVMSVVVGMSLATAHELSVSSAFSSTLYQIIPDGDMATVMVIGVLYGSLMFGRLLGNITTTRISSGTSYLVYSSLSGLGTAGILAGIMADIPSLIVSSGVIASIGMGNYFSQMFAYIIRKHPELQSQISQGMSFTMPIAVGLSMPITYLNDWLNVPYARVMASLAMLVASMIATNKMLDNSTLYKFIKQEFKEASDYVVGLYKDKIKGGKDKGEEPPTTDLNNPLPN